MALVYISYWLFQRTVKNHLRWEQTVAPRWDTNWTFHEHHSLYTVTSQLPIFQYNLPWICALVSTSCMSSAVFIFVPNCSSIYPSILQIAKNWNCLINVIWENRLPMQEPTYNQNIEGLQSSDSDLIFTPRVNINRLPVFVCCRTNPAELLNNLRLSF